MIIFIILDVRSFLLFEYYWVFVLLSDCREQYNIVVLCVCVFVCIYIYFISKYKMCELS